MPIINKGIFDTDTVFTRQTGNDWPTAQVISTADVVENSSNLYFTTERARAAFAAGTNITIVDGTISSGSLATVVNDSTVITTANNTVSYSMGRNITDPRNILVIVEGMIQIPTIDYTVSGSSLIFTSQPPINTNVEVRFFGTENATTSVPTLVATVNTFVGNGSNTQYSLTLTPPSKEFLTVIIDGVAQLSDAYSVTGRVITFSEAPVNGANIDVKLITGQVGGIFTTRTFVGDGTANTFTISEGFNKDTILVFENGVAQMPTSDYIIESNTLRFITPPAANVVVQVRELGVSGPNLLLAIRGLDQNTGNLSPLVDGIYGLGTPTNRYKSLFLGNISLSFSNGQLVTAPIINGQVSSTTTPVSSGSDFNPISFMLAGM
jgi:hypothetical protein